MTVPVTVTVPVCVVVGRRVPEPELEGVLNKLGVTERVGVRLDVMVADPVCEAVKEEEPVCVVVRVFVREGVCEGVPVTDREPEFERVCDCVWVGEGVGRPDAVGVGVDDPVVVIRGVGVKEGVTVPVPVIVTVAVEEGV